MHAIGTVASHDPCVTGSDGLSRGTKDAPEVDAVFGEQANLIRTSGDVRLMWKRNGFF
jgi:hypothetical protein